MNIEVISSSPRTNSITSRVAVFLHRHLRTQTQHSVGLLDMRAYVLPFVQTVWHKPELVPENWQPLAERMFAAEAFVIVSPEYNGSYSPAVKNLFDHFSKQIHKPFGIVTASPGTQGGMRAAQQLFLMTTALWGIPSPQLLIIPEVDKKFDEQGNISDASFQSNVDMFVKEYLWLAEALVKK
jgi:NAD(P)H-dependent FMN reductase